MSSTDTLDLKLNSWQAAKLVQGTPFDLVYDAISAAATAKAAWGVNDLLENYDGLTVELEKGFDFAIVLIQNALAAAGIQKPEGD